MTLGAATQERIRQPFEHAVQHHVPADIDLDGGTLLGVEEFEEIDPEDNCKVHVTRYNILSADGTEESTLTKRRKMKVNCTQSLKRVEFTNGNQSKIEEKTMTFDGQQAPPEFQLLSSYDVKEDAMNHVFLQTPDHFLQLLDQKRDQLVQSFPDLFTDLRTLPAIFDRPSAVQEIISNPDGTTVMRTRSSKAFRSHYSHQETYVNGVKQETKSKFRAFMQYAGPEGGFRIKINDNPDDDLSEDECDTDNDSMSLISRFNHSMLSDIPDTSSEIPDNHSALIVHDHTKPMISGQPLKRFEQAWYAVNELVESESRYVQKLFLLERFREEVEKEKVLDKKQMNLLFSNISSLYRFHNDHLLPQLMDQRRYWRMTKKISDVIKKQAPFLKLYSEYTNNYKNATRVFEESAKRKKFDEIVRKMEEYQKHLQPTDPDHADTAAALERVMEAASHANEMMRKLDRYRNVLDVQEQLGGVIALVSPSRELLKFAKLQKISSSTDKTEERLLYVFNDLVLLASERALGIGSKLKLRAIFDPLYTQICEGDNLEREFSFYLRGADGPGAASRCVELFCHTQNDKATLIDTIWAVISDTHQRRSSFRCANGAAPANGTPTIMSLSAERKACYKCEGDFSWLKAGVQCAKCQRRFCKKCFGPLKDEAKHNRVCVGCSNRADANSNSRSLPAPRQNLLDLPTTGNDIIKASAVKLRNSSGKMVDRYFVLRSNFCLYSYGSPNDSMALALLPLSGCDVVPGNEKQSLLIKHLKRQYCFVLANESEHAEWLAALVLSANARIPGFEPAK